MNDLQSEEQEIKRMQEQLRQRERKLALEKERVRQEAEEKRKREEQEKFKTEHPWEWKLKEYQGITESIRARKTAFYKWHFGDGNNGPLLCIIDELHEKHDSQIRQLRQEVNDLKAEIKVLKKKGL